LPSVFMVPRGSMHCGGVVFGIRSGVISMALSCLMVGGSPPSFIVMMLILPSPPSLAMVVFCRG
jgi:hypothetical protein